MRGLQVVSLAMLIWGSLAWASLPSGEGVTRFGHLQTIQSWMAHLNFYYPSLNLKLNCPPKNSADMQNVLHDLRVLENALGQKIDLPNDTLMNITCTRPECGGGGGGGGCKTCYAPFDEGSQQDSL